MGQEFVPSPKCTYTSSWYFTVIFFFHFFWTKSFQFGASTSVRWHEGILDDGLCRFRPVGEYRPQSDLAAGLIYVLLCSWISLPLLESPGSSSQKGKGSSHLMHFRFDAGTPVFFGTWASMHEGDASFSGEETNLPVTHSDPGEAEIGEMGKPSFGKGSEDGALPLQPCLWSCSEPGAASSRGRAGLLCCSSK